MASANIRDNMGGGQEKGVEQVVGSTAKQGNTERNLYIKKKFDKLKKTKMEPTA